MSVTGYKDWVDPELHRMVVVALEEKTKARKRNGKERGSSSIPLPPAFLTSNITPTNIPILRDVFSPKVFRNKAFRSGSRFFGGPDKGIGRLGEARPPEWAAR